MFKILYLLLVMINPNTLVYNLTGLVGFRQPYNPAFQKLSPQNQASRSGLYVNDNPFVKIETIYDSQDFDAISDADFNTWLQNKVGTSIVNVANAVFNQNDFIDRQVFYKNALNKISENPVSPPAINIQGNNAYVYPLPPGFNGYWIRVADDNDVAFNIKRVMLEFNGTGTIKLYLFNTADLTNPLFSQTVAITKPYQEVTLLDGNNVANGWTCDNSTKGAGYKGDYYIGYFTNDATGLQPFQRQYREAIIESSIKNVSWLRSNFAQFTALGAPFDLIGYTPFAWYNGLNIDMTVYYDYTDLITQNEKLFARAIQLDCQANLLAESIASIRSNRNERLSAQFATQIAGESGDDNVKVVGIRQMYAGALKDIRAEMVKLKKGNQGQGQILVQTLS